MKNIRVSGIYFSSVLVMMFIFLCVLKNIVSVTTSILEFSSNHQVFMMIIGLIITFFPTLWLFYSDNWQKHDSFFQKLLLFSVTVFLLSPLYSVAFQAFFYVAVITYLLKKRTIHKPYTIYCIFFFYFLVHLISLLWTNNVKAGLDKMGIYSFFLVIPLFFCFFQLNKKDIDILLLVFFRGVTLFVFLSLFSWVYESTRLEIPLLDWFKIGEKTGLENRPASSFLFDWVGYRHPTYISIGYSIALIIGYYLAGKKESHTHISGIELVVFNVVALTLAILSQTRAGLLNVLLISFLGICWLLRNRKKILYTSILFGIVCAFLFLFFFKSKISLFISDPVREQLFATVWAYIKEHIFLGTGVGGMTEAMHSDELAQSLGYPTATCHKYPHNQFLGDLMQTGLLGFATLCAMLVNLFYNAIKVKEWTLFGFAVCFMMIMLIEMPFLKIKGITFFLPFCCLLMQKIKGSSIYQNNIMNENQA